MYAWFRSSTSASPAASAIRISRISTPSTIIRAR